MTIQKIFRKRRKHTTNGYSPTTYCSIDRSKSKADFYGDAYWIEKFRFCADIKKYATEKINYGKEKILPLTDVDIES